MKKRDRCQHLHFHISAIIRACTNIFPFFGVLPMLKTTIALTLSLVAFQATADDLYFPINQADIVRAFNGGGSMVGGAVALDESDWGDQQDEVKVGARIEFNTNSTYLNSSSIALLDEYGRAFKGALSDLQFFVVGHTDNIGGSGRNLSLSMNRAQAVIDYLVNEHGISEDRLTIRGKGELQPIASNETAEGRAQNRRVEFIKTW
ncbi:MAG: OmpA family protein [Methylococcales bacterium]|nr:OmpA family protein [Methylococcales bacterium]